MIYYVAKTGLKMPLGCWSLQPFYDRFDKWKATDKRQLYKNIAAADIITMSQHSDQKTVKTEPKFKEFYIIW